MDLPNRLLSEKEVAEILGVDTQTIKRYEKDGILRRVKNIKVIRYSPDMLAQLIGLDMSAFTPYLLKREQQRCKDLEQENAALKGKISQILSLLKADLQAEAGR